MSDDDLLERRLPLPPSPFPGLEPQSSAAPSPDRSGRQLDEPRALIVPAQLGVHWALHEPQRARRPLRARGDRGLRGVRQTRRRHINGFLEEGAIERIWLVEQCENLQPALHEQALERDLGTGHEVLHQELPGPFPAAGEFGRGENALEASVGGDKLGGLVGADHPAAGGQAQRLQDARVADGCGERLGVFLHPVQRESGHCDPGGRHQPALVVLVASGDGGSHRVALEPQRRGDGRRDDRRVVVDPDHAGDRMLAGELPHLTAGALGVGEVERQQAVGLRGLERAGPLRGDRQLHAEAARCFDESGGAVGAGRKKKKDPGRGQITSWTRRSRGSHPRCGR